jgi:hypothetical protein
VRTPRIKERLTSDFLFFAEIALMKQIRMSSEISNGDIILNVDCDMYSNNAETVNNVLCFFMDKEKGCEYAFVQLPQSFNNITKNDIYNNSLKTYDEVSENANNLV